MKTRVFCVALLLALRPLFALPFAVPSVLPPSAVFIPAIPEDLLYPPPSYLKFAAVGDNLIHIQIITSSRITDAEGAPSYGEPSYGALSYDFSPLYSHIKEEIADADIAFINMETIFAGEALGLSGYPRFNGPIELGKAVIDAGFNVVNHATNHIMDKGEEGVRAMLDYWKGVPAVTYIGIFESDAARKTPVVIKKNGIKVGFLAYTYGTNGLPVPKSAPYLVPLIDTAVMKREIAAVRPLCDYLIVSMHWGEEYEMKAGKKQEELAALLAACDVDLVIAHHPHVLQEARVIPRENGKKTVVFFSLGNFISAQNRLETLLGALARVVIVKDRHGARTESAFSIPLVTHYEKGYTGFTTLKLADYTDEMAARHGSGVMDKSALLKLGAEFTGTLVDLP